MKRHVLVVDDEEYMRSLLSRALSRSGFFVTTVADATEALSLLTNESPVSTPIDFLLTDFNLPNVTGLDLFDALRSHGVELPCFLMSGSPNEKLATEALSRGFEGFMKKPFSLPVLVEHIREALEVRPDPDLALRQQIPCWNKGGETTSLSEGQANSSVL